MAADQPAGLTLAVTLVVESSLTVAQQWRKPLFEYLSQCLRRLTDAHHGAKLRLAFVGYATADTTPSPILSKQYFTDFQIVFREMADNPSRFGIGTTNSGGSRGMAALEGLVASIELFDSLQTNSTGKSFVSHIIHIAASPPDSSRYPSWNETVVMDDVDWDTLPQEMKKRNIHYNTINLKPSLPRFPQLHNTLNSDSSRPWFNVRPPHACLLAPLVALQPTKGTVTATKRQNETQNVEHSPESKRPRLQPNTESPKPTPKPAAAQPPPPPPLPTPPAVANPPPPRPIQSAPSQPTQPTQPVQPVQPTQPAQPAQLNPRVAYDASIRIMKQLEIAIPAAMASGNTENLDAMRREYVKRKEFVTRMGQAIQAMRDSGAASFPLNNPTLGVGSAPPPAQGNPAAHVRSASGSAFRPNPTAVNPPIANSASPSGPANLNLQMQKMIEQQNRLKAGGPPVMGGIPNPNPMATGMNPMPGLSQPVGPSGPIVVWKGSLIYSGTSAAGKKEVCIHTVSMTANPANAHAATWPQVMHLTPTAPLNLTLPDLQGWIKMHKAGFCLFRVPPDTPDPKTTENYYTSLVQLLSTRKIFATAAWTTPSGGQTKNALFFPWNNALAGAMFPLTGLPDLPKPSISMSLNPPPSLNPADWAQLTPDQRQAYLLRFNAYRQQQQLQLQQQQQQFSHSQDGNAMNPFSSNTNVGHANMNAALNMMNTQHPAGQMVGMNAPQLGLPTVMPRPALNGPPSFEMLQSFMQRNADNSSSKG